ncbi:MAG: hypothetical protein K0Q95_1791 [Bacteroidota bacterium]|jgi:uncharacterized protein (TIGR01777 family)|nr:hypothetical protein [Bacteroidota bacterium]
MKTILITGASGLIGKHLTSLLISKGYRVIHLSRKASTKDGIETFVWDVSRKTIDHTAVYQADYIIHLAGAAIADRKWTEERKKEIIDSRTESTRLLFESIKRNNKKLLAFISASAIGYYGAVTSDHTFIEEDPAENDFMGTCCKLWEDSTEAIKLMDIRTVKIRVGVVLAGDGGALTKMLPAVKAGLGSALGSGKQFIPWIHIDDICNIFLKAVEDKTMSGPYNGVAPAPVTSNELNKSIAKVLHKPYFFPNVPKFVLKFLFGDRSIIFLEGSRVSSEKIEKAGFTFRYKKVEDALKDLLVG